MTIAVALIADPETSRKTGAHLRDAGFDVDDTERVAHARKLIVLVDENLAASELLGEIHAWLRDDSSRAAVIVSTKPASWTPLHLEFRSRVLVLPAPTFAWEIIDAVRALEGVGR